MDFCCCCYYIILIAVERWENADKQKPKKQKLKHHPDLTRLGLKRLCMHVLVKGCAETTVGRGNTTLGALFLSKKWVNAFRLPKRTDYLVCFQSSSSLSSGWSLVVTPSKTLPLLLLLPGLWLFVSSIWPLNVGMLQGIALLSSFFLGGHIHFYDFKCYQVIFL